MTFKNRNNVKRYKKLRDSEVIEEKGDCGNFYKILSCISDTGVF